MSFATKEVKETEETEETEETVCPSFIPYQTTIAVILKFSHLHILLLHFFFFFFFLFPSSTICLIE